MKLPAKPKSTWSMPEAKADFGRVVEHAVSRGPQLVTKRGEPVVLVLSVDELVRMRRRKKSVFDLFDPLVGPG